jgi:hypothetical protein
MPSLALGSTHVFFQALAPQTQFTGRSKAQTDCLALEGSPPRSLSRVDNLGQDLCLGVSGVTILACRR